VDRGGGDVARAREGREEMPDIIEELRALETETFEIEDVDAIDTMVMGWSSSSCSCSSCCSCSTSSCCSSSTSTGCGGG
jgi:hypothetical protein